MGWGEGAGGSSGDQVQASSRCNLIPIKIFGSKKHQYTDIFDSLFYFPLRWNFILIHVLKVSALNVPFFKKKKG